MYVCMCVCVHIYIYIYISCLQFTLSISNLKIQNLKLFVSDDIILKEFHSFAFQIRDTQLVRSKKMLQNLKISEICNTSCSIILGKEYSTCNSFKMKNNEYNDPLDLRDPYPWVQSTMQQKYWGKSASVVNTYKCFSFHYFLSSAI